MDSPYQQQQHPQWNNDDNQYLYRPTIVSPPPAAPPPPPPPSSPSDNEDDGSTGDDDSYYTNSKSGSGNGYSNMYGRDSRAAGSAIAPAITNYGLSPSMASDGPKKQYHHSYGDYEDDDVNGVNNKNNNMGCFQFPIPFARPSGGVAGGGSSTSSNDRRTYNNYHDGGVLGGVGSNDLSFTVTSGVVDDDADAASKNLNGSGSSSNGGVDYSNYSMSSILRGDTTIRPNNGNTNADIDIIPGSLREKATALRTMTVVVTISAVIWEGFAFLYRILSLHAVINPSEMVLGLYLGLFCLLLLGVELNLPLRDKFGFLYNPLWRGLSLILMSTMALGVLNSWWESLLGVAFIITGIGYVYTYIRHPEYRRWQDYNQSNQRPLSASWQEEIRMYWDRSSTTSSKGGNGGARNSSGYGSAIWANPDNEISTRISSTLGNIQTMSNIRQTSEEARSLLHSL